MLKGTSDVMLELGLQLILVEERMLDMKKLCLKNVSCGTSLSISWFGCHMREGDVSHNYNPDMTYRLCGRPDAGSYY